MTERNKTSRTRGIRLYKCLRSLLLFLSLSILERHREEKSIRTSLFVCTIKKLFSFWKNPNRIANNQK